MTALRPAGLGPIIGHTTDTTCRVWAQAPGHGAPGTRESDRRTVGVIGIVSKDRKRVKPAYYFRLPREFDRTGSFVLGEHVALGRCEKDIDKPDEAIPLEPDTDYIVRVGTLAVDDPMPDDETLTDLELAKRLPPIQNVAPMLLELPADLSEARVQTFPDRAQPPLDQLDFLLGSCRYPGLLWKIKEADRIFAPMLAHLKDGPNGPPARFSLMVGDQIYADMLNRHIAVGRADTYDEFQERYQTALGSPNMRALLRAAPSYMILDDHEIEDNWTHDRESSRHALFQIAIGAYMSYQWSHSARSFGRLFYYHFECGGYPFFVLDTRTQRVTKDVRDSLEDNHMLGRPTIDPGHPGQLGQFLDWLGAQQDQRGDVPKFVVSSSVFAPNPMSERIAEGGETAYRLYKANPKHRDDSDSWPAYPKTRLAILERISQKRIQNVVFLTGDVHCSNIAKLTIPAAGGGPLTAYDVTSSAFYWPFPFADGDPNGFVHDSSDPEQLDSFPIAAGDVDYRAFAFTQEDNFARLSVDKAKREIAVRYFTREGAAIEVRDANRWPTEKLVLPLAPWT